MSLGKDSATSAQYAQFGFLVAQQVVAKMEQKEDLSKKEMQQLLTPPYNGKINDAVNAIVKQIFEIQISIPNVWDRHVEKLTKFWKENFNHDIVWNELKFPEEKDGFNVLEYIPVSFTEDDVFNKYKELFGKDKVWCYYHNQSTTIRESIQEQQARPTGNRLILHRGGQEPDTEYLNKSYDNFSGDGKNYMIPIEGLIAALRYRVETDKMMDVKGLTRFHALDHDGDAMCMCRDNDDQFRMGWDGRGNRDARYGPREVSF